MATFRKSRRLQSIAKQGREFPLELSLGVTHQGRDVVFVAIIRDITERKRADEALHAASRELEETNAELAETLDRRLRRTP